MVEQLQIEERASQPTLSIRDQTSLAELPNLFDRAFSSLTQRLAELGVEPTGPAFAYYHTLDMENLDIEVGFPVNQEIGDSGEIKGSALPAGRYCSGLYTGAYDGLPAAWEQTIAHATGQGHTPEEFAIEFYVTNPAEVAAEENQTLLLLPLQGN